MNRRGFVLLSMCAIGFLIAIVVFYQSVGTQMPGDSNYLGEKEVLIYNIYAQGEEMLFFIDTIALHSINKAKITENVDSNFEDNFQSYLVQFNEFYDQELNIEDYTFIITSKEVAGVSSEPLIIQTNGIEYKVDPNFRISY